MIPQAVASVLQFHSAHKNVFLSDCIILLYLLSHLSHSVMPKLCFIEITESNICVATYPHISASPFWRELFLMNVDKLRSLPSPFPWVQCAFHWKYIHPRKGTPPHTHTQVGWWDCIAPAFSTGCRIVEWLWVLIWEAARPEFKSQLFHFPTLGPWDIFLSWLIFSLLICKINGDDNSTKIRELLNWAKTHTYLEECWVPFTYVSYHSVIPSG